MNFCDHCQGQRFDRARVLRALRQVRKEWRTRDRGSRPEAALAAALQAVRALDILHLETEDEDDIGSDVVH